MDDLSIVAARLDVEIFVNCPNEECDYLIDLLREDDCDGDFHNDDGALLSQVWPRNGSHDDFECDDVVCSQCKTKFSVKTLEW